MKSPVSFVYSSASIDHVTGAIELAYDTNFQDGSIHHSTETLTIPADMRVVLSQLSPELTEALLEYLHLAFGIVHWALYCASDIKVPLYSLSPEQVKFWNTVYTKGLGEFFFVNTIDFHGLVNFPVTEKAKERSYSSRLDYTNEALVAFGGGKDSVVAAHLLKSEGYPFDLYTLNEVNIQRLAADVLHKSLYIVQRTIDRHTLDLIARGEVYTGHTPSTFLYIATGVLLAILTRRRYVVLANERSADEGNLEYHGMHVNHQWSKSSECEQMVREYVAAHLSPDIVPFSILRPMSELEITRRFSHLRRYHHSCSSCNKNFTEPGHGHSTSPYWCGQCPKCAFVFTALAAFLPKREVVSIIGTDMYARWELVPLFASLLGVGEPKPFECVGTASEVQAAFVLAYRAGEYADTPAMTLFTKEILPKLTDLTSVTKKAFELDPLGTVPHPFRAIIAETEGERE